MDLDLNETGKPLWHSRFSMARVHLIRFAFLLQATQYRSCWELASTPHPFPVFVLEMRTTAKNQSGCMMITGRCK
jgi:hypothetical protein